MDYAHDFSDAIEAAKEHMTLSLMADIICGVMDAASVRELMDGLSKFMPEETVTDF